MIVGGGVGVRYVRTSRKVRLVLAGVNVLSMPGGGPPYPYGPGHRGAVRLLRGKDRPQGQFPGGPAPSGPPRRCGYVPRVSNFFLLLVYYLISPIVFCVQRYGLALRLRQVVHGRMAVRGELCGAPSSDQGGGGGVGQGGGGSRGSDMGRGGIIFFLNV